MASQYHLIGNFFGRDPKLRAADADREATAERLRESHAEGRLDMTEFQQRLERCYEAKTVGELDELLTDLPRQEEAPERYSRRLPRPRRLMPLAPLLIGFILVSALIGHHHIFWLWIPLVFLFWRMCWWRWRPRRAGGHSGPGEWI